MKFKIKYADQIVGLFIVLALVMFGTIVILLGVNQRWFAKNYHFKAVFSSGSNLSPGTGIFMKGFQVGKIDKIKLNDENMVDVEFHIYDTYYPKVKEYSLLELSVSPIGVGTQLLFHPGLGDKLMEEGTLMHNFDSIEGQAIIEQELVIIPTKDDTITRLLSNINPLLENVNKTVVTVNRTLTEINRALAGQSTGPLGDMVNDASATVARLPGTMDNVDAIVADVQSRVGALMDQVSQLMTQVGGVIDETEGTMASVGRITGNLEATTQAIRDPTGLVPKLLDPSGSIKTFLDDDNALYKQVMSIVGEIEKSVRSLQSIVSNLNGEVPKIASVLNETKAAIEKAQDVLEGVKNNPLIKGGIPERLEQDSLYQSMRQGDFE